MDKYAVFGNPIAQSKSPQIHQAFAAQCNAQLSYQKILAPKHGFTQALTEFFSDPCAKGCNVTLPFKQQAADWVDQLSDSARLAGAVNTIIRLPDGSFAGDNTDGAGLVNDILAHAVAVKGKRILLIGAGGAARGVIAPLLAQQPSALVIVNRTKTKAIELASLVESANLSAMSFDELPAQRPFDVIINSTSASLDNQLPPINDDVLAQANAAYDMVYGNKPTVFMCHCQELGVPVVMDGLGMLVGQAAESFRLWRGCKPYTTAVLTDLRQALKSEQ